MIGIPTASAKALVAEGHTHLRAGRMREAEHTYRQALALDPGEPEALAFLGMMAGQAGQLQAAADLFERALKRDPRNADLHHNLGETYRHLGDNRKALACFERAITVNPAHIEAYRNGAEAALAEAAKREAAGQWGFAAELKSTAVEFLVRAGQRLLEGGNQPAAAEALRRATELAPTSAEAWGLYGKTLVKPYPTKALAALRRSVEFNPKLSWVQGTLADAFSYLQRDEEARNAWQALNALDPGYRDRRSHLSTFECLMHYEGGDKAEIFAFHRAWAEAVTRRQEAKPAPFKNDRDPARRLRVGYVSADFCDHSVAYFLEPLLAAHDRDGFEIACYAAMAPGLADRITARFKALASLWRDVAAMDDDAFRRQVRADRIDILIDLSGHFEGSRLAAMATKPAPVTVTWLGYPATTGLKAIDWRITDAIADPPGEEAFHTERLMRLPGGFLCYGPQADAPEPAPLPALAQGHVTFGSFNNQLKINRGVIAVWARILKAVPHSRLCLKSEMLEDEGVAARLRGGFTDEGVPAERVELVLRTPEVRQHLAAYGRIDIGLDPFPYNGATTTCQSLWMGVPVVTLIGDRHAGRVGFDLLSRLGLERLAAPDPDAYVRIAADLAQDYTALAELRSSLRDRMARSPLCDAPRFAREFEAALRAMWRSWCEAAA